MAIDNIVLSIDPASDFNIGNIDPNPQSPNKFHVAFDRFPNMSFSIRSINVPSVSTNAVQVNTNQAHNFFTMGDKIDFTEDFVISFILDQSMDAYYELQEWIWQAVQGRDGFMSDFTVLFMSNKNNVRRSMKVYNAFPTMLPNIQMDVAVDETNPIYLDVPFKYSHFKLLPK